MQTAEQDSTELWHYCYLDSCANIKSSDIFGGKTEAGTSL